MLNLNQTSVLINKGEDGATVTFQIVTREDATASHTLVKLLVAEYEITDAYESADGDEFKVYMPNSQLMLVLMFEEENKLELDGFYKSMCLAHFAKTYDAMK